MISRRLSMFGAALLLGACATAAPEKKTSIDQESAPPPPPSYVRADFMGATAEELDEKLGEPGLIRREGEGEYRRYSLVGCRLIIILYPDESDIERAAHLDAAALTSGSPKPDLDACLAGRPAPMDKAPPAQS